LRARLDEIIDLSLRDDTLAWQFDGTSWTRATGTDSVNAQAFLQEGAARRSRGGD
jgi:hypothetical protein